MENIDKIGGDVVDPAIRVHRELGPGLLESVYETILAAKLATAGYEVFRQHPVAIDFEDMHFECGISDRPADSRKTDCRNQIG